MSKNTKEIQEIPKMQMLYANIECKFKKKNANSLLLFLSE